MTQQQFEPNWGLMSLIHRSVVLSTGVAVLLAGGNAFALNSNPTSASSQRHLPRTITLAQNVEQQAEPQDSVPDVKASGDARFGCQFIDGQYTVMYIPESQPGLAYPWAVPGDMGSDWPSERRCNTISERLESYRPDGLLEMRTAVENGYNTVCVTTEQNSSCRIVLTVPPGQDPELTRDRVFENIAVADNGVQTSAVNTFVGNNRGYQRLNEVLNRGLSALGIGNNSSKPSNRIDLRPFLDRADGGTGTQLRGGIPVKTNSQLNPDRFR